jgi:plasmid segregation protein ParM
MKSALSLASVDVGFGGVKIVSREGRLEGNTFVGGEVYEAVMPAGAGKTSGMPRRMNGEPDLKGGEEVMVNGESWVAGVEQVHIQGGTRQTHKDYTSTDEHHALYLAGLARIGAKRIDLLVTGLPVERLYGPNGEAVRKAMVEKMQGRHHVNSNLSVEVGKVVVIPQPMGAFMNLATSAEGRGLVTRDTMRTLVLDPGFGTVDWVCMSGRSVLHESSGSSQQACSVIMGKAARKLSEELGRQVTADELDAACRRGDKVLLVGLGTQVDYLPFIEAAAEEVGKAVMGTVRASLRNAGELDLVLACGGGAWMFQKALKEAFPRTEVISSPDAVLANARGFLAVAEMTAPKLRQVA